MKDQGQALLDEGFVPLMPGEDNPTITDALTPVAGEDGRTYKTRASELFPSPQVQILLPCRSECTNARPDCGSGPEDAPVLAQGCFAR
jgi:hypothetical protein